jgi:hypothetical protein
MNILKRVANGTFIALKTINLYCLLPKYYFNEDLTIILLRWNIEDTNTPQNFIFSVNYDLSLVEDIKIPK